MADKLTQEQKAAHVQNALQKLDHPAFFARLSALGIEVSQKEAADYLALGEELLLVSETQKQSNGGSSIAAARAALHKNAAAQGIHLGTAPADQQLDAEVRQFTAVQLQGDETIAAELANLV